MAQVKTLFVIASAVVEAVRRQKPQENKAMICANKKV
jgi:hypothetical protein